MRRLGVILCALPLLASLAVTAAPAPVYKDKPARWFGLRGWNEPESRADHASCSGTVDKTTIVMPERNEGEHQITEIHRDVEGDFRMKVRVVGDFRPNRPDFRSAGIFLGWGSDCK